VSARVENGGFAGMSAASGRRYTGTAILLHWLVALVIFGLIGLGWYMVDIPKNTPERSYFFNLHKSIGLVALFLILVRVGWRAGHVPPPLPASLKGWEIAASTWSHRLLYACMLIMPLSGYIASNFTKFGVKFFGIDLPPWGPADKTLQGIFNNIHVVTSYVLVALIALHVLGAFKHLLVDKDSVFRRMLPGRD
jgi:cytochrome b561